MANTLKNGALGGLGVAPVQPEEQQSYAVSASDLDFLLNPQQSVALPSEATPGGPIGDPETQGQAAVRQGVTPAAPEGPAPIAAQTSEPVVQPSAPRTSLEDTQTGSFVSEAPVFKPLPQTLAPEPAPVPAEPEVQPQVTPVPEKPAGEAPAAPRPTVLTDIGGLHENDIEEGRYWAGVYQTDKSEMAAETTVRFAKSIEKAQRKALVGDPEDVLSGREVVPVLDPRVAMVPGMDSDLVRLLSRVRFERRADGQMGVTGINPEALRKYAPQVPQPGGGYVQGTLNGAQTQLLAVAATMFEDDYRVAKAKRSRSLRGANEEIARLEDAVAKAEAFLGAGGPAIAGRGQAQLPEMMEGLGEEAAIEANHKLAELRRQLDEAYRERDMAGKPQGAQAALAEWMATPEFDASMRQLAGAEGVLYGSRDALALAWDHLKDVGSPTKATRSLTGGVVDTELMMKTGAVLSAAEGEPLNPAMVADAAKMMEDDYSSVAVDNALAVATHKNFGTSLLDARHAPELAVEAINQTDNAFTLKTMITQAQERGDAVAAQAAYERLQEVELERFAMKYEEGGVSYWSEKGVNGLEDLLQITAAVVPVLVGAVTLPGVMAGQELGALATKGGLAPKDVKDLSDKDLDTAIGNLRSQAWGTLNAAPAAIYEGTKEQVVNLYRKSKGVFDPEYRQSAEYLRATKDMHEKPAQYLLLLADLAMGAGGTFGAVKGLGKARAVNATLGQTLKMVGQDAKLYAELSNPLIAAFKGTGKLAEVTQAYGRRRIANRLVEAEQDAWNAVKGEYREPSQVMADIEGLKGEIAKKAEAQRVLGADPIKKVQDSIGGVTAKRSQIAEQIAPARKKARKIADEVERTEAGLANLRKDLDEFISKIDETAPRSTEEALRYKAKTDKVNKAQFAVKRLQDQQVSGYTATKLKEAQAAVATAGRRVEVKQAFLDHPAMTPKEAKAARADLAMAEEAYKRATERVDYWAGKQMDDAGKTQKAMDEATQAQAAAEADLAKFLEGVKAQGKVPKSESEIAWVTKQQGRIKTAEVRLQGLNALLDREAEALGPMERALDDLDNDIRMTASEPMQEAIAQVKQATQALEEFSAKYPSEAATLRLKELEGELKSIFDAQGQVAQAMGRNAGIWAAMMGMSRGYHALRQVFASPSTLAKTVNPNYQTIMRYLTGGMSDVNTAEAVKALAHIKAGADKLGVTPADLSNYMVLMLEGVGPGGFVDRHWSARSATLGRLADSLAEAHMPNLEAQWRALNSTPERPAVLSAEARANLKEAAEGQVLAEIDKIMDQQLTGWRPPENIMQGIQGMIQKAESQGLDTRGMALRALSQSIPAQLVDQVHAAIGKKFPGLYADEAGGALGRAQEAFSAIDPTFTPREEIRAALALRKLGGEAWHATEGGALIQSVRQGVAQQFPELAAKYPHMVDSLAMDYLQKSAPKFGVPRQFRGYTVPMATFDGKTKMVRLGDLLDATRRPMQIVTRNAALGIMDLAGLGFYSDAALPALIDQSMRYATRQGRMSTSSAKALVTTKWGQARLRAMFGKLREDEWQKMLKYLQGQASKNGASMAELLSNITDTLNRSMQRDLYGMHALKERTIDFGDFGSTLAREEFERIAKEARAPGSGAGKPTVGDAMGAARRYMEAGTELYRQTFRVEDGIARTIDSIQKEMIVARLLRGLQGEGRLSWEALKDLALHGEVRNQMAKERFGHIAENLKSQGPGKVMEAFNNLLDENDAIMVAEESIGGFDVMKETTKAMKDWAKQRGWVELTGDGPKGLLTRAGFHNPKLAQLFHGMMVSPDIADALEFVAARRELLANSPSKIGRAAGRVNRALVQQLKYSGVVFKLASANRDYLTNLLINAPAAGLYPWDKAHDVARAIMGAQEGSVFVNDLFTKAGGGARSKSSLHFTDGSALEPRMHANLLMTLNNMVQDMGKSWDVVGTAEQWTQRLLEFAAQHTGTRVGDKIRAGKGTVGAVGKAAGGAAAMGEHAVKAVTNLVLTPQNSVAGQYWQYFRGQSDDLFRMAMLIRRITEEASTLAREDIRIKRILDEIAVAGGKNTELEYSPKAIERAMARITEAAQFQNGKRVEGALRGAYSMQALDKPLSRLLTVMNEPAAPWRLRGHDPLAHIVDTAAKAFVDYSDKSRFLRGLTGSIFGAPFFTYPAKMVPRLVKNTVQNPIQAYLLQAMANGIEQSMWTHAGMEGKWEDYLDTMPSGMRQIIPTPFRDSWGVGDRTVEGPVVMGVAPYMPFGQVADTPVGVPIGFNLANTVINAVKWNLSDQANREDPMIVTGLQTGDYGGVRFQNKRVVEPGASGSEAALQVLAAGARSLIPSVVAPTFRPSEPWSGTGGFQGLIDTGMLPLPGGKERPVLGAGGSPLMQAITHGLMAPTGHTLKAGGEESRMLQQSIRKEDAIRRGTKASTMGRVESVMAGLGEALREKRAEQQRGLKEGLVLGTTENQTKMAKQVRAGELLQEALRPALSEVQQIVDDQVLAFGGAPGQERNLYALARFGADGAQLVSRGLEAAAPYLDRAMRNSVETGEVDLVAAEEGIQALLKTLGVTDQPDALKRLAAANLARKNPQWSVDPADAMEYELNREIERLKKPEPEKGAGALLLGAMSGRTPGRQADITAKALVMGVVADDLRQMDEGDRRKAALKNSPLAAAQVRMPLQEQVLRYGLNDQQLQSTGTLQLVLPPADFNRVLEAGPNALPPIEGGNPAGYFAYLREVIGVSAVGVNRLRRLYQFRKRAE